MVASRTVNKAEKLIDYHPRGIARQLNAENTEALKKVIEKADIVISLLPWIHHVKVAELCLEYKKNLVTTSYVKPEMRALDEKAKKAVYLNLQNHLLWAWSEKLGSAGKQLSGVLE